MSLLDKILGRPLASSEMEKEELGVLTGVPVLGLDALSSTAYGPEAALTILTSAGLVGLHYLPAITLAILMLLVLLYVSYRQTIAAYPNGGGAYIVAKENLGTRAGLLAAAALLLDYTLNVAVGISAGIAAMVSAVPMLERYTLGLCLFVLLTLTIVNLRGVRESGLTFGLPTLVFVACVGAAVVLGVFRAMQSAGHPQPIEPPPALPAATQSLSAWLLLRTFANGCTAMTGVEAVSNGVPLFRKPKVQSAHRTLTVIVVILGLLLIGVGYLSRAYHIGAMDQSQLGYQTVLSQLVGAVAGRGIFYYVAMVSILTILTFSANTSFADFPRVCRLLAEDNFLPHAFAERGRRLVFSIGISVLAILSALILIAFGGITEKLIPLFAVGAFSAFTFSQAGMVIHWRRKRGRGFRTSLVVNGVGAMATGIALVIIIIAKFVEGAWITLIIVPGLMVLFFKISAHYKLIAREVERAVKLKTAKAPPPAVIVPISGWNRVSERALRFATQISDDVTAVHVGSDKDENERLQKHWEEKVEKPARAANAPVPRLVVIYSPYRQLYQPLLDFVKKIEKDKPDQLVAVIIPELVEPHWYEYLLHNHRGKVLKALVFLEGEQRIVVISTPWYLKDE
ncbi:MAG TPA: APC family permease [Blastocatellia bacterium]|nr:APC family permease [Blastocatellia bacterium]